MKKIINIFKLINYLFTVVIPTLEKIKKEKEEKEKNVKE